MDVRFDEYVVYQDPVIPEKTYASQEEYYQKRTQKTKSTD